jgi:hypothetical protein
MSWYYVNGSDRLGPVDDVEFQRLSEQGVIRAETLVWRDGMADWKPRRDIAGIGGVPASGSLMCAACGRMVTEAESFILSGRAYCGACKPEVLQRINEGRGLPVGNAEEVRQAHIKHEASVKSIGLLYYLGGVALVVMGLSQFATLAGSKSSPGPAVAVMLAIIFFVMAAAQFVVGSAVRRLRPWSRIGVGILSGIGLFGFPVGTIINGYILYLVFSKKGEMLFTPEYHEIVALTPHIRYRTSIVVWIVLGLVVFAIFAAIAAAVVGAMASRH